MKKSSKKVWSISVPLILFLVLSCIVVYIFTHAFAEIPTSLYIDEVAMLVDAKSLVATGRDMHGNHWLQALFPSYGDYKMPVYLWFVYVASLIFSPSAFAVRLPSLLAGIGTFFVVYGLLRSVFEHKKGVVRKMSISKFAAASTTVIVVGFSPWALQFSRTGFEAFLGQFLLAAAVLVLVRSKKSLLLQVVSILLAVAATYTYFSVRYVWVPVFTVWVVSEIDWQSIKKMRKWLKKNATLLLKGFFGLILFGLLLVPLVYSPLYEASMQFRLSTPSILQNHEQIVQANTYRTIAGNTLPDRLFFHRLYFMGQELARNVSENLSLRFLFLEGDSNLRHGTGKFGLFLVPMIVPFFAGVYVLARKKKWQLLICTVWILSASLPASVPLVVPHALRFLNALVPLSVITAVGLYELLMWTYLTVQPRWLRLSAFVGFSGFFIFYVLAFLTYYFSVYPNTSAASWDQKNTELAVAISPYISEEHQIHITGTSDTFYLWLLAFGPYQGDEFSTWSSDNYKFTELGAVSYGLPTAYSTGQRFVIPKEQFEMITNSSDSIQLELLQEIQLSTGDIFVVAELHSETTL